MSEVSRGVILGLTGAAGCGKSSIASELGKTELIKALFDSVYILHFASRIKVIAAKHFGWDGRKDEKGRKLLQTLGTECGRAYNENIWVDQLMNFVDSGLEEDTTLGARCLYIIDDVRFQNEVLAIRERGGQVLRVVGRGADLGANTEHSSESGISALGVTGVIGNAEDGDEALHKVAVELAKHLNYYYG